MGIPLTRSDEEVARLLADMGSETGSSRPTSPMDQIVEQKLSGIEQMLDVAGHGSGSPIPKAHRIWRTSALSKTRVLMKKHAYNKSLKKPFMCIAYRMLTLGRPRTSNVSTLHDLVWTDERSMLIALEMMDLTHQAHDDVDDMSRNSSYDSLSTLSAP